MSLVIDHISMSYGKTAVLHDISAEIGKGEFLSILGHSGCGKTTLLKIIGGFMKPTGGRILMDGTLYSDPSRSLPPEKRDMGMVFQSFALWPHMTVRQHVEFPLQCRNKDLSAAEKEKRIAHALEATGLNGLEDRYPDELSGGQKQRVSLARAIVSGPSLLLMDKPLSALDADLRISMRKEISRIHRLTGTTVIFVTHDQGEALSLSDRIMVLNGGRIEQLGTPQDIYLRPATKFIASFIGRCNFVKGDWNGDTFRAGEGSFVFQGAPVADVFHRDHVCPIRPEQFRLAEDGSGLPGVIREKQYNGREIHYAVSCQDDLFSVYTSAAENYAIGDEVYLQCR